LLFVVFGLFVGWWFWVLVGFFGLVVVLFLGVCVFGGFVVFLCECFGFSSGFGVGFVVFFFLGWCLVGVFSSLVVLW